MDEFKPRRAVKERVILRMNIQGPSGSGKTEGAIALACTLAELIAVSRGQQASEGKVCVVDTENNSALLYADKYIFDHIPLNAPYTSERYRAALKAVVDGKYDVCVCDTLTHWWKGDGGVLQRKDAIDTKGGNGYTNWGKLDPEISSFVEYLKHYPLHIIFTARSKQDIVLQDVGDKKNVPVKVGLKAELRDGMDYEFDLVFEVDKNHNTTSSKDRTRLFNGRTIDLLIPAVASELYEWATSGVEATVRTITLENRRKIFGALKHFNIEPEVFKGFMQNQFNTDDSLQIPASQLSLVMRWIKGDGQTAVSQDEKIARQSMESMQMTAPERATLIQKHRGDWAGLLRELEDMNLSQDPEGRQQPEDESQETGEFYYEDGDLQCVALSAVRKEGANNREFMELKLNGKIEGKDIAFCWHKSMFPALSEAKGKVCMLTVVAKKHETKGWTLTVEDVRRVGDLYYTKGSDGKIRLITSEDEESTEGAEQTQ